jgi:hypothetical protein
MPGRVEPAHAPVPRSGGERFLFAQLYRTLVGVDCNGRARPELAASWRSEAEGRRWTFTLSPDARDWEGVAVTASDVGSSWIAAQEALAADARAAAPPLRLGALTVIDPRTLRVDLPEPATVEFFARPELAVRTRVRAGAWPVGTGPFRPSDRDRLPPAGALATSVRLEGPVAVEMRAISGDARDALDSGVDVWVTRDPVVIGYARAGAGLSAVPLAWDRRYLLATGVAAAPDPSAAPVILRAPEAALAALARDAVRIEARGAGAAADPAPCSAPERRGEPDRGAGATGGARPAPRIVYPAGDAAARSLAERLVALALDPSRADAGWLLELVPGLAGGVGPVGAAGLAAPAFAAALRAGRDAAYVVGVDVGAGRGPCESLREAIRLAPWLRTPRPFGAVGGSAVLPLVETRSTLVLRRGIGGLSVDGDGVLLLDGMRSVGP